MFAYLRRPFNLKEVLMNDNFMVKSTLWHYKNVISKSSLIFHNESKNDKDYFNL